jgi:hypothetical protein
MNSRDGATLHAAPSLSASNHTAADSAFAEQLFSRP